MINHLAEFDEKQLCSSTVYNWREQDNISSEDPELIFITLDRHFAFELYGNLLPFRPGWTSDGKRFWFIGGDVEVFPLKDSRNLLFCTSLQGISKELITI